MIEEQPTVEAVPKSYAEQIRWERDCSCPSRDIPEPLPYSEDKGMAMASYIQGWNDCLNALLGNS